jgi:hypothetical protein
MQTRMHGDGMYGLEIKLSIKFTLQIVIFSLSQPISSYFLSTFITLYILL